MNEKLHDALNEISDKHVNEAETYQKPKSKPYWVAAVAALLVFAIGMGAIFGGNGFPGTTEPLQLASKPTTGIFRPSQPSDPTNTNHQTFPSLPNPSGVTPPELLELANLVAAPKYPKRLPYVSYSQDRDAHAAWWDEQLAWSNQFDLNRAETQNLDDFFLRSTQEFLAGDGNQVYSPLNVYMALAMLAETSDGNSRQEILNLLGADSIEALRYQAKKIWYANYSNDNLTDCLLANSVWLDDAYSFQNATVQSLADNYFGSVFHGDLGTETVNEQLRAWLNANTGGLLKDQIENAELSENAVFALVSTLYFSATWDNQFSKNQNTQAVFHSPSGDYLTTFMHNTLTTYYWSDHFGAVRLSLNGRNNGSMWLILPDEGYTPQDILKNGDWLKCVQQNYYITEDRDYIFEWENETSTQVNLSLPKFDVSARSNLVDSLKNLGLNDVFDPAVSDFSPICTDTTLSVNKVDHAVRVAIDEEGVTGSAFTIIEGADGGYPPEEEIDFILDRPFLFVITGLDGLPLFTGIVNEP